MSSGVPRGYTLGLMTAALLGILIVPSKGHYGAAAMVLVFVALGLVLVALVDLVRGRQRQTDGRIVARGFPITIAVFLATAMIDAKLLIGVDRSWWTLRALCVAELALLATYLRDRPLAEGEESRWPAIRFALFAACVALSAIEVFRISPEPDIDVWTVQTAGARALLQGANPFDVVRVPDTTPGRLDNPTPYVYPPFQLFVTIPALLFGGDVRFAMTLGLLLFGVSVRDIAVGARDKLPALPVFVDAPALLVWLSPKVLFVLQQAWIDPVQLGLIAGSTALALRKRTWAAAIGFGLVLAAKQTMFWVAPLAFVAFPGFRARHALAAIAVAALFYLPFALWSWHAFYFANIGFVGGLPPRTDALSFVNFARRALDVRIPPAVAFPFAGAVVAWVVARRRARADVFGTALLITYFFFFTFNKWAFANYYFTLVGFAALGAVLALQHPGLTLSTAASRPATAPRGP